MEIVSKEGDMVDELALRAYGRRDGTTTALVLAANPALCQYPVRLPAGVRITIPDRPVSMTDRRVKLWD